MGVWRRFRAFLRVHVTPLLVDRPWKAPFTIHDGFLLTALAALSAITRFHAFWRPNQPVLGEIETLSPLAKLIFSACEQAARCDDDGERVLVLRWAAICVASMVPPVWYICVRVSSFSRVAAFTAASLVLFDTTMVCTGRLAFPDSLAHLLVAISMAVSMRWFSLKRDTAEWRTWMVLTSTSLAAAASVKAAAALLFALPLFHEIVTLTVEARLGMKLLRRLGKHLFEFLWPALVTVLGLWWISEELLREPDHAALSAFYEAPWNTTVPQRWNISHAINAVRCANIDTYKPKFFMSHPINWPLMTDIAAPLYTAHNQHVLLVGNLFIYVLSLIGIVMVTITLHRRLYFRAIKFVIGYLMTYLPLLFTTRTLSQRDYCIPLMFGAACYGIMLDFWLSPTVSGSTCILTIALAIFGYFEWCPLVYGRPITDHEQSSRLWFSTWASGRCSRQTWLTSRNQSYICQHPCL